MPPKRNSRSRSRSPKSRAAKKSKSPPRSGSRKSGGKSSKHGAMMSRGHDYWTYPEGEKYGGALEGTFKIKREIFDAICDGKKTHDVRLNYGIFRDFKTGEVITVQSSDSDDTCKIKIKSAKPHKAISEAVSATNFKKIMPGAKSKEEVVELLESIPRFKKKQGEHGVLLIEFEKQ